jgi:glycosyltransferase involved in cell wall biosynthesis
MSDQKAPRKPVILVFVRYYLPGFKSGGPVRSVSNLVQALGGEYDFRIVCLDRDHGENHPYPNVELGQWHRVGAASVYYATPREAGFALCRKMLRETEPDMIYLNSLLDRAFSMKPLLVLGCGRRTPILLAPRGELSLGALGLKLRRKQIFLFVARAIGLYANIHWHASSKPEVEQTVRVFSPQTSRISLASNLPEGVQDSIQRSTTKQPGTLRIVLAARISLMKNTLAAIRMAGQLTGAVEFDLWGPLEDKDYWIACQRQIALCPSNVTVRYRGEIAHEKLHALLHEYDVMLLPTLGENFGHAIIEALAAGLPVVISDRTPWRKLKSAGVGADLPLEDEAAFVHELDRYQAMDECGMAAVRDACHRYVGDWHVDNANLNDYRKMFDKVIASRPQPCK